MYNKGWKRREPSYNLTGFEKGYREKERKRGISAKNNGEWPKCLCKIWFKYLKNTKISVIIFKDIWGFVGEEEFLSKLSEIAKNAIGDACTGFNPRQPDQADMEKLLRACYYDLDVDF